MLNTALPLPASSDQQRCRVGRFRADDKIPLMGLRNVTSLAMQRLMAVAVLLSLMMLNPAVAQEQATPKDPPKAIIAAARAQIGKTVSYDPAYVVLKYPGGDVPIDRGVCSDVIIRALRTACGADLQQTVHEDMAANFSAYPKAWGLKRTDKNIDHRRVLNLRVYLKRKGCEVPATKPPDYRPGDLITCTVAKTLPHIMIVSDTKGPSGQWMIIHNIGGGAQEEDRLLDFPITGHYRWKP